MHTKAPEPVDGEAAAAWSSWAAQVHADEALAASDAMAPETPAECAARCGTGTRIAQALQNGAARVEHDTIADKPVRDFLPRFPPFWRCRDTSARTGPA